VISEISGIDSSYEIPDALWNQISSLLVHKPKRKKKKTGRPRMEDRKAMNAIFYIARTGCQWKAQWKALPRSLGASSTVHDRFQEWRQDGVFKSMWIDGLKIYDEKVGINWKWQSMDGAITKAPLGGKKYRTKPNR
jgi:putative transposase